MTCSAVTHVTMKEILTTVTPAVLADMPFVFHRADRPEGWSGLMLAHAYAGGAELTVEKLIDFSDVDGKYEKIVRKKIETVGSFNVETSIEMRDPPTIWGGGSRTDDGECDAVTGAPELCDHLLLHAAQCAAGRISQAKYHCRTAIDHQGVRDAIDYAASKGLHVGGYLSMKNSIEARVAAAADFNFYS